MGSVCLLYTWLRCYIFIATTWLPFLAYSILYRECPYDAIENENYLLDDFMTEGFIYVYIIYVFVSCACFYYCRTIVFFVECSRHQIKLILFYLISYLKKTTTFHITDPLWRNPLVTGGFRARDVERFSMSRRLHVSPPVLQVNPWPLSLPLLHGITASVSSIFIWEGAGVSPINSTLYPHFKTSLKYRPIQHILTKLLKHFWARFEHIPNFFSCFSVVKCIVQRVLKLVRSYATRVSGRQEPLISPVNAAFTSPSDWRHSTKTHNDYY